MTREVMQQTLEAGLESDNPYIRQLAANAVRKALEQPVQKFVEHTVIAGALFDFMGYLTSRKRRIVLSAADEASPAVDAINDFAKMRGLSLGDAQVLDWQDYTTPPLPAQRPWQGLTDAEIWSADPRIGTSDSNVNPYQILKNARAIEAKLKERNHG